MGLPGIGGSTGKGYVFFLPGQERRQQWQPQPPLFVHLLANGRINPPKTSLLHLDLVKFLQCGINGSVYLSTNYDATQFSSTKMLNHSLFTTHNQRKSSRVKGSFSRSKAQQHLRPWTTVMVRSLPWLVLCWYLDIKSNLRGKTGR